MSFDVKGSALSENMRCRQSSRVREAILRTAPAQKAGKCRTFRRPRAVALTCNGGAVRHVVRADGYAVETTETRPVVTSCAFKLF